MVNEQEHGGCFSEEECEPKRVCEWAMTLIIHDYNLFLKNLRSGEVVDTVIEKSTEQVSLL
jgi:hypothetical protein